MITGSNGFLDKISTGSALNPVFGLSSSGRQTFCQYHQDCVNERLIGSQIRVEESSIKATCSSLAVTLLKYRRQKNRVASLAFSGRLLSVLGDFFFFWRVLVLFAECRDCATCCVCQLFDRFDVYWSIIVVWMVLDWWPLWATVGHLPSLSTIKWIRENGDAGNGNVLPCGPRRLQFNNK